MPSRPSTGKRVSRLPEGPRLPDSLRLILVIGHGLVVGSSLVFLVYAYLLREVIPRIPYQFALWTYGGTALLNAFLLFLYWLKPVAIRDIRLRYFSVIAGMAPWFVIQAISHKLEISSIALITVFGFYVLTAFDLISERRKAMIFYIVMSSISLLLQYVVRPYCAFLEPTEVTHGELVAFIWKIGLGSWAFLVLVGTARDRGRLEKASQEQAQLNALKAEAEEARRLEAEARYLEAEALRRQLEAAMKQAALMARYEALMRSSYGVALPAFLRRLLEYLREDLGFVVGVAYAWDGQGGEVAATYAVPERLGQRCVGGLLQTAANLRQPYGIEMPALAEAPVLSHVVPLTPRYALYLPLWAEEVHQQTIAVLELLFLDPLPDERLSPIATILPRLGSYLWLQSAKTA